MINIHLIHANILTAFHSRTVGTKVLIPDLLTGMVLEGIGKTNFVDQKVPGQAFIMLPDAARAAVSAGVGPRSEDPDHYVIRKWRDHVGCYLKRQYAAPVEAVAAIVYTREAYTADPEVQKDQDAMMKALFWNGFSKPTHVLVSVLGFAGPKAPLSPGRFVSNLAGGNKEALVWTADEIRTMAADIVAYNDAWSVVAD